MAQRLNITQEHRVLIKAFKDANLRGFAEIQIPEGKLSAEFQHDTEQSTFVTEHSTFVTRLKTANGSMFTRTLRTNFSMTADKDDYNKVNDPKRPTPGRINIIESVYDTERKLLMDFRNMGGNGYQKFLRIGNLNTMRSSAFPVVGKEEARNFLEVFRGEYPHQKSENDNSVMMQYPGTIFYGPDYFNSPYEDIGVRRSQTGNQLNCNLRERRGKVAVIEDRNNEKMGLYHNWQEGEMTFFGITKEYGEITITAEMTENNIPDINLSIFPILTSIVQHFDTHEELEILNNLKRDETIVPILVGDEVLELVYQLFKSTMEKL